MATTKLIISVKDSNDMDSTASPHSLDKVDSGTIKGVENPIILQVGRSGGLCLWWKYGTSIQILSANKFVIDTNVQEYSGSSSIHISWFYGPSLLSPKRLLLGECCLFPL
ncbi:hypothetical protein COP1_030327 [Malus domestica]